MPKQRLNSAGWTVLILGLIAFLSMVAAAGSIIVLLNQSHQLKQLTSIAQNTQNLLNERVVQNEAAEARRREGEKLVEDALNRIRLNTALSVDCAYLRRLGIMPDQCREVNERIDQLKRNETIEIPPRTTTTTIRSSPPSTTTTRPTSTTTTTRPPPTTTTSTTHPCVGIRLLGLCIERITP